MIERIKKYAKVFSIWYILNVVLVYVAILSFKIILEDQVLLSFMAPALCLLYFAPIALILFFLFKKVKSDKARIVSIATLLPLYSLGFYFLLFSNIDAIYIPAFFIFTTLLVTHLMPKSILPEKMFHSTALAYTLVVYIALYFILSPVNTYFNKKIMEEDTSKLTTTIEYIEKYKAENGEYPDENNEELNKIMIQDELKIYNFYEDLDWNSIHPFGYKNRGESYLLFFTDKHANEYRYCSNINDCNYLIHKHIQGNWFYFDWD